jgi:hypothetical protein
MIGSFKCIPDPEDPAGHFREATAQLRFDAGVEQHDGKGVVTNADTPSTYHHAPLASTQQAPVSPSSSNKHPSDVTDQFHQLQMPNVFESLITHLSWLHLPMKL